MENISESLIIVFAVVVFIMALSLTVILLSKALTASNNLLFNIDKTNYLSNLNITSDDGHIGARIVGIETVINSLYRYYKENFTVRIFNNEYNPTSPVPVPYHVFDTTIEGKVYKISSKNPLARNTEEDAIMNKYDNNHSSLYLSKAPWEGNTNVYAKTRVDLFVSGQSGYINNYLVDYHSINLEAVNRTDKFTEIFIEYKYDGETISTDGGIETIEGNQKEKNKIIIDYYPITP